MDKPRTWCEPEPKKIPVVVWMENEQADRLDALVWAATDGNDNRDLYEIVHAAVVLSRGAADGPWEAFYCDNCTQVVDAEEHVWDDDGNVLDCGPVVPVLVVPLAGRKG